jgi:drug/metabolite transporter (DMT)-like permease
MIVVASLGYAIGGLLVKRRLGGLAPLGVAATVLGISTIFSAPAAVLSAPGDVPGLGPVAAVAALGVIGTGAAFAIFYGLISRVGPARAFVVTYLAPGFAVVYGVLLLDESVGVATIAGLALILGGSYLAAEGRLPWQQRPADGILPEADPGAGGLDPGRAADEARL